MRSDKPAVSDFKWVCMDFPNLSLLNKSAILKEFQVIDAHAVVGNKPLEETVTPFALLVSLEAPTMVTIGPESTFAGVGKHIRLPATKVFLCAAIGNLFKSNKICDWMVLNAILLLPFLIEEVVLEGDKIAECGS